MKSTESRVTLGNGLVHADRIPYLTLEDLAVEGGVFPANEIQTRRRHPLI